MDIPAAPVLQINGKTAIEKTAELKKEKQLEYLKRMGHYSPVKSDQEIIDVEARKAYIAGNITSLECQLRDNSMTRKEKNKIQHLFVPNGHATASALDDPVQKVLQVARDDIELIRQTRIAEERARSNRVQEQSEKLSKKIEATRKEFRRRMFYSKRRPSINADGAHFTKHFMCSFGDVVYVDFIAPTILVVFGSDGVLEIWKYELEDPKNIPEMVDIFQTGPSKITTALEYTNKSAKKEEPKVVSNSIPVARVASARRQGMFTENSILEEFGEEFGDAIAADIPVPIEQEILNKESPETDDDFTRKFFIGFESGHGAMLKVRFKEAQSKHVKVEFTMNQMRKLSKLEIEQSSIDSAQGYILIVTWHPKHEFQLVALNEALEVVWSTRASVLSTMCRDRLKKSLEFFAQGQVYTDSDFSSPREPKNCESLISMIRYDDYNNCVLVVMSWGAVLQMSFDVMSVLSGDDEEDSTAPVFVKTYHAHYLMEAYELHVDELPYNRRENTKVRR